MKTRWLICYAARLRSHCLPRTQERPPWRFANEVIDVPPAEWLAIMREPATRDESVVLVAAWPLPKKTVADSLEKLVSGNPYDE